MLLEVRHDSTLPSALSPLPDPGASVLLLTTNCVRHLLFWEEEEVKTT